MRNLMKIGISGAGGVGKTTLIRKLAPFLEHTVIPDVIDTVLEERGYRSFKDVSEQEEHIDIRLRALERKIALERGSERFISDKTVCDYYAYWLLRSSAFATREQNFFFHSRVREHIGIYDKILIPRFGLFALEDNGLRSVDYFHQCRVHCLIKGIYLQEGSSFKEVVHTLEDSAEKVARDFHLLS